MYIKQVLLFCSHQLLRKDQHFAKNSWPDLFESLKCFYCLVFNRVSGNDLSSKLGQTVSDHYATYILK